MRIHLALHLLSVTGTTFLLAGTNELQFEISVRQGLLAQPQNGRLFVILSQTNSPEPRLALGKTGVKAPVTLAKDMHEFAPGHTAILDKTAAIHPFTNLSELKEGDYFAQSLFDFNPDIRLANASGNIFSAPQKLHLAPSRDGKIHLELTEQLPPEQVPPETELIKFVKIQSKLLSEFHHRPIFLRAGVILPHDFAREPERRYPLWVRIGGFGARYTRVASMNEEFNKAWRSDEAPRFILLYLDGAGPLGDPYQINSANHGPYGDAVVQELIPFIEKKFRAIGESRARVLSGSSTGGWVALALQVFYPDFFNGAWSFCPDPVDFRAYELVDIYHDDNAYVNAQGYDRPSERALNGDTKLTMREELRAENLLGCGDSYALSGQQWGSWNAVFSTRGADGLPVLLWDAQTGKIDHGVAEQWKEYDLHLVLEKNWKTLAPKLRGKIRIAVGEADDYFLNNAVHLLDEFLTKASPPSDAKFIYGPGKGHGWNDLSILQMLNEMKAATELRAHSQ